MNQRFLKIEAQIENMDKIETLEELQGEEIDVIEEVWVFEVKTEREEEWFLETEFIHPKHTWEGYDAFEVRNVRKFTPE